MLKHIVLSHHGKLEYGSPKLPMLPEAIVVAMVDDMDSKMNTMFHFLKNESRQLLRREIFAVDSVFEVGAHFPFERGQRSVGVRSWPVALLGVV